MTVSKLHLQLLATLLRRGVTIDHASSMLTVLALLIGVAPVLGVTVNAGCLLLAPLMLLLGVAEKYWAQRVAIDAELFDVLAQRVNDFEVAGHELDTALHALGLVPAVTVRSFAERSRGALSLLRRQIAVLAAQSILALLICLAVLVNAMYY